MTFDDLRTNHPLADTDAERDVLDAVVGELGRDEIRVLTSIAKRLRHGTGIYGFLRLARDRRGFRNEAREELEDFLVYLACRWLVLADRGGAR